MLGTLGDFIFLAILGWAGGLPWLALGYIGLQFSSNMAHGPMQGLMPDQLPPEQLGAGSGFKNLIDMLGMVVSSLFLGRLFDPTRGPPQPAAGGDHRGTGSRGGRDADRRAREGGTAYQPTQPCGAKSG